MQVKYAGPRSEVFVPPYGPHRKGAVKEYPDNFARELLATSKKQQFEERGIPPAPEKTEKVIDLKPKAINEIHAMEDMTNAQIKGELDTLGIKYPDRAKKSELYALYKEAKSE